MENGGDTVHTVYGNRIIIDIDFESYEKSIQEIFSAAGKNNLEIKINQTHPVGITNVVSLEIKGDYEDRKKFISELEKTYEIKFKRDLI